MTVHRVSEAQDLLALQHEWNCLTRGVPLRSWQWLFSWWRHFGQDRELYVLTVRDERGVLVGVAPWFIERRVATGRTIQFLGSGEVCTDYLTVLTTYEHEDQVVYELADWLTIAGCRDAAHADRWDLLDLEGLAASDSVTAKLAAHLHEMGCTVNRRPGLNCWRAMLPGSWDVYVAELPKPLKRKLRKTQREAATSTCPRVVIAEDRNALDRGLDILIDLHQRRRQSLGERGCFASAAFTAFLREAAEGLLASGGLRLAWLEWSGRPVACELMLTSPRVCYIYQSGMDPDALARSPGHVLTAHLIERAIAEGREAIDFLRGDEAYKSRWQARPLSMLRLRIAPNRLAPQVRNGVWIAGQTMKQWVKTGLTLAGMH